MSRAPSLTTTDGHVTVSTPTYSVSWTLGSRGFVRSPYLQLSDADGARWTRLCALSSVHTAQGRDETTAIAEPVVTHEDGDVLVTITTSSSQWAERTLEVRCTPEGVELTLTATGHGSLGDVTLFGGDGILPTGASGTFRSSIDAASLFVPTPTEPVAFTRPATSPVSLGIVGDADAGRLHGIFSPPPLALAFGRAATEGPIDPPTDGDWWAASVRAHVDELRFTALCYEPIDGGFLLRLPYEGHTVVDGTWRSPTLVLRAVRGALDALDLHRADLVAHGFAPDAPRDPARWWREPMFCGWGAQVARGGAPAPDLCRQEIYDQFLMILRENGLEPGTIVVDDRWQRDYGTAVPDGEAWPDLRGWIAERHAEGRRVLLWWKAWDPAGLPVTECVTDAAGRAVAADPGSAAYRARLHEIVARLLGPGGLDADGFKLDFTQRAPSGQSMRAAEDSDGVWGMAALHRLLRELHAAAKSAKPDALVITHAVHPSFGDVADMIRTNDVLERDTAGDAVPVALQLEARHAIVRRTLPHHLVDTDQWPMPDKAEWLAYAQVQAHLGVPALYYLERVRDDEPITADDLATIRRTWDAYREAM